MKKIKQSTNKIYAGVHWGQRKAFKDLITRHAARFCQTDEKIKSWPVEIRYRFIFRSRPLDTTNCTFLAKAFEDAFRSLGILPDDSPEFVARTIIEVPKLVKKTEKKKTITLGEKENKENIDWLIIHIKSCNYVSDDI